MTESEWTTEWTRSMGLMLNGKTLQVSDDEGNPLEDDSFLILVNAFHEGVEFTLPPAPNGTPWCLVMDTQNIEDPFKHMKVGEKVIVGGRSMMVFSDSKQVMKDLNKPDAPRPTESQNPGVPSSSRPS
jgi:glycogen operon protein